MISLYDVCVCILCVRLKSVHSCVCVCLVAGKVLLERSEEVAYDGHAPGAPQQPLSSQAAHVGHVCVVDREAKHPGQEEGRMLGQGEGTEDEERRCCQRTGTV